MSLREGEDYYVERGLYVFTAAYLRRRGYCCASGCRHCPYWPPHAGAVDLAADGLDAAQRKTSPDALKRDPDSASTTDSAAVAGEPGQPEESRGF